MIFEKLLIERKAGWIDRSRPLTGLLEVDTGTAKIEFRIDEDTARKILELCAQGMVDAATQLADLTRASIIEGAVAIEHKAAA